MSAASFRFPGFAMLAAACLVLAGCPAPAPDPPPSPEEPAAAVPVDAMYMAALREVGESGVRGEAHIEITEGRLSVHVGAAGLEPDARVPMHIHHNASCDDPGGILINLDRDLSVGGEAPPAGMAYPTADANGRIELTVRRPLDALAAAFAVYQGMVLDDLDLGNRVVNVHAEEMQVVACGELGGGA